MKKNGQSIEFESSLLRYISSFGSNKFNGLAEIVLNDLELITPAELLSAQCDSDFPEKNDLKFLRSLNYSRAIFLDKRSLIYSEHFHSDMYHPSRSEPDIIIVSPDQIKTNDMVKSDNEEFISLGRYRGERHISSDMFEELRKDALEIPKEVYHNLIKSYAPNDSDQIDILKESSKEDIIWRQRFLEFILEGNLNLINEYIKNVEHTTGRDFYESMVVNLCTNEGMSLSMFEGEPEHLLQICYPNKRRPLRFQFDDSIESPFQFIATTEEFRSKYNSR